MAYTSSLDGRDLPDRLYDRAAGGQATLDNRARPRRMGGAACTRDPQPHRCARRPLRRRHRRLGLRRVGDGPAPVGGGHVASASSSAARPYPPGSFPRSPWETARNFWDPSEGLHGLFDVWSFRGLGGIVASGLGGGSLHLGRTSCCARTEHVRRRTSARRGPSTYDDLEPHYERHERMLAATPLPVRARARYATAPARRSADASTRPRPRARPRVVPAAARGRIRPGDGAPVARRADPRRATNLHGRTRLTCRLCGECNIGCNYGSKNTLDFNYLSAPQLRHGADDPHALRGEDFAPRPGAATPWTTSTTRREGERRERPPTRTVTARPARARGGHVRHDLPPAQEPGGAARAQRSAGRALLRQRRPADASR